MTARKVHPLSSRATKEAALRRALKQGRKVLWRDENGWHAAVDWNNVPGFALETEAVEEKK